MRTTTRYILRQLVWVTVFITGALTLAVWLSQSLRFMDYIVNRGLPVQDFLKLMAFLLPQFFGVVLPIAAFVAVLFVYNKLLNESELVVMRSSGLSQLQLARPALIMAGAVTLVVYVISLYLLPLSYREFKDLQYEIRNSYSAVLLQEGVFNSLGDGLTVYVRERTEQGDLEGILVHDTRNQEEPVTMIAKRGAIVNTDAGPRVLLVDGNRQQVDPKTGTLSMLYFDRYTVDVEQLQASVYSRWRQPKERFLSDLFDPGSSDADQRYRAELIAEGHYRITFPLYTVAFTSIGLASILTGEFSRRGQLKRIVGAVVAVAALQSAQLGINDVTTRNLALVPAMYLLVLGAIAASLALLLQRRRQPRNQPRLRSRPEAAA